MWCFTKLKFKKKNTKKNKTRLVENIDRKRFNNFFFWVKQKETQKKRKKNIYDRAWCWNMFKQEKSCQKWNDNTMPNIDDRANMQLASYIAPRSRSCIHATQFNGCKWCFSKQQTSRFFDRELSFSRSCFPSLQKKHNFSYAALLIRNFELVYPLIILTNSFIFLKSFEKWVTMFQNHSSSFLNFEISRKRCTKNSL